MDKDLFKNDPRDFALSLVEDGLVSAESLLTAALVYMSTDEVRDMLDANELSPRFDEDEEEDEEEEDPEAALDDFNYVGSRHHY